MRRLPSCCLLLLWLALASTPGAAVGPTAVQARAVDVQPDSRLEGEQALDGAVAAAVIGAISSRFGEREVQVKLERLTASAASERDRQVQGHGALRLGALGEWLPFSFDVLYDTVTATAGYPRLRIGSAVGGEALAAGDAVARDFEHALAAALREEFPAQPALWRGERVLTRPLGERYLQLEATGSVDFAAEGRAPARVEALYDRRERSWVQLDYQLAEPALEATADAASTPLAGG